MFSPIHTTGFLKYRMFFGRRSNCEMSPYIKLCLTKDTRTVLRQYPSAGITFIIRVGHVFLVHSSCRLFPLLSNRQPVGFYNICHYVRTIISPTIRRIKLHSPIQGEKEEWGVIFHVAQQHRPTTTTMLFNSSLIIFSCVNYLQARFFCHSPTTDYQNEHHKLSILTFAHSSESVVFVKANTRARLFLHTKWMRSANGAARRKQKGSAKKHKSFFSISTISKQIPEGYSVTILRRAEGDGGCVIEEDD